MTCSVSAYYVGPPSCSRDSRPPASLFRAKATVPPFASLSPSTSPPYVTQDPRNFPSLTAFSISRHYDSSHSCYQNPHPPASSSSYGRSLFRCTLGVLRRQRHLFLAAFFYIISVDRLFVHRRYLLQLWRAVHDGRKTRLFNEYSILQRTLHTSDPKQPDPKLMK